MKNDVYLFVEANYGNIVIPFKNLKELDLFTSGFDDQEHLMKFLIKVMDMEIQLSDISDAFVLLNYMEKKNNLYGKLELQIKYSSDDYDEESLKHVFANYLKYDSRRIKSSGIRNINYAPIIGYVKYDEFISDREIDLAVDIYLNSGYMSRRKTYFMLKNTGYNVTKKVSKKKGKREFQKKLSSFETDTSYFEYLIDFSRLGDSEYEKAMELIASYDLDTIERHMQNPYYGLVDGVTVDEVSLDDVHVLEETTGMSIDNLKRLVNNISGKKRRKR